MKKNSHKNNTTALRVDDKKSFEEQIARRAHEIWQERGQADGGELADWLQAEREITEWHQSRAARG